MRNLDLALIGNGRIGALLDADASIVWALLPALRRRREVLRVAGRCHGTQRQLAFGRSNWSMVCALNSSTSLIPRCWYTRLHDRDGGIVELTDCVPRFYQHGRLYQPMTIVRSVRRIAGNPRVIVRCVRATATGATNRSATTGKQPHALRRFGPDAAVHDRRVADCDHRGAPILCRRYGDDGARCG